jgi:dienelactone hydrolase
VSEIVLFHHVQGLTAGIVAFADALRRAGHVVHTPDLFGGRTFESLQEGLRFIEHLGFGAVIERGEQAVENLPTDLVYAGFSLGVGPAQKLAQTRAGARGALFYSSCVPVSEFGAPWPKRVPVQVHAMAEDPIFTGEGDLEAARALTAHAENGVMFLYPGSQHCFADNSLASYDAEASALLMTRTLEFLGELEE